MKMQKDNQGTKY